MKTIFTRVIVMIILGALLIALPVEIIGLVRNQKTFEDEVEDKMEYAIKSAGTDLDVVFKSMESLVDMLEAIVKVTFSDEDYIENYDTFSELKKQTGSIIERTLESTENLSGLYLTFSPQLHSGKEEVWYAYRSGKVEYIDARLYAPSWLVEGNPRVDYYYDAIRDGAYWGGPDYESSLDEYMVTHTKSVHDSDGNLIGIVGSDMLITEVSDILRSINLYSDSHIALFDENMKFCASGDNVKDPEEYYSFLVEEISEAETGKKHIWYTSYDGEEHIAAYTVLNNGWILAATQKVSTVMTPANETRKTLMLTMFLTVVIILVLAAVLIKRYYGPVVRSAEQNEIILINQSRQAKLGEMVGNIAHQCKQPLNSINIDISNMKDDYFANELTEERFSEYEKKMRENVSFMSDTITDFADFLKPDRRKEQFNVRDSVVKALSIMKESIIINEIKIVNETDPDIFITGYRNEFTQCIFNVLENARDAAVSSPGGLKMIKISSDVKAEGAHGAVYLDIYNTGDRIDEENASEIFLPYYSTKEDSGGTGIGLYMVKQILESHFGGEIFFRNSDGGVTFTIRIYSDDMADKEEQR